MIDEQTTGRPITAEDLFNLHLVSDPQPSPNGKRIAYVVTRLDKPVALSDRGTRAVQSMVNRCLRPSATPSAAP